MTNIWLALLRQKRRRDGDTKGLEKVNGQSQPDYRPPEIKFIDKIPIPQEEHPNIGFMGLLVGTTFKTFI